MASTESDVSETALSAEVENSALDGIIDLMPFETYIPSYKLETPCMKLAKSTEPVTSIR